MGHNGCDGSQASGPWAIGSGYRFSIALLSEYIRDNLSMAIIKREMVDAWSQHGWSFTIRSPIGNFDTIMDDDVFDTKVRKIFKLKRAHTLLTNLENLVRHKTSCDLQVALRPTRNKDCDWLQQLYNEDCINVDLRRIYDSSDSDTDDEQHPSVMNCGPPTGKQRTRPPVRFSLYPNLDEMVATDRMYGTLEEWQVGDEMALLSIKCVNCSNMTETPPCCLQCTAQYLGLTIKQTSLGCGLFATRNFEIGDVIVPYLSPAVVQGIHAHAFKLSLACLWRLWCSIVVGHIVQFWCLPPNPQWCE